MLELGSATNDEAVLAFLRAEIDTEYGPTIGLLLSHIRYDRSVLIDNPDLSDAHANCARAVILGVYRGYGRNEFLFTGFPSDIKWWRVLLSLDDIGHLKYVHTQVFFDLSSGTRLIAEGARNYEKNTDTAKKIGHILEKISGGVSFPELILVEDAQKQLVIIEGNHRATAYAIAGVGQIFALIGTSPTMHLWPFI